MANGERENLEEAHQEQDSKKEFHLLFVAQKRIPPNRRGRELIFPDYKPFAEFLATLLPEASILRDALLNPKNGYAFRGLRRPNDSPEITQALDTIEEFGVDRGGPNGDRTWFETSGDYSRPLDLALPRDTEHTGFLIISRKEGMYQKWRSWLQGTGLKPGHTFKSLHIGTIALRMY
jgi:hypothetical protein